MLRETGRQSNIAMIIRMAALIFLGSVMFVQADQLIERVQQALKDQGFYYGEVSGETSANLTAAIRRYQIRNGLQVSGELNNETLQSLGIDSSGSAHSTTKAASPSPAAPARPDEESPAETGNTTPAPPVQGFGSTPPDQQVYPSNPMPHVSAGGVLAGTPFETAPPPIQRNVIVSAQIALARRGLYREEINGVYGPAMEFSLRAYQAQRQLAVTGRLDMETLAALRLLPGERGPFPYIPRRPRPQPPW